MALFDWNHDGKKDWKDNCIEYQIYKNATNQKGKSPYTSGSGGGEGTFKAIISVVSGLFLQVLLYMALGIDVDDVPGLLILILWIIISSIIAVFLEVIG